MYHALISAAREGKLKVVQRILKEPGIDVNDEDTTGWTALTYAAWHGHLEIVQCLVRHPEICVNFCKRERGPGRPLVPENNYLDYHKLAPLHCAAQRGHLEIERCLLGHPQIDANLRDCGGRTALMHAACDGHLEIVQSLVQHPKIDVNLRSHFGQTALIYATIFVHHNVVQFLLTQDMVIIHVDDHEISKWWYGLVEHTPLSSAMQISDEFDQYWQRLARRGLVAFWKNDDKFIGRQIELVDTIVSFIGWNNK